MGLHSLLDGIKTFPTCFIHGKRTNHFNSLPRIQSAQHESMLFPTTSSGPHYSFLSLASTNYMFFTRVSLSNLFPQLQRLHVHLCYLLIF